MTGPDDEPLYTGEESDYTADLEVGMDVTDFEDYADNINASDFL